MVFGIRVKVKVRVKGLGLGLVLGLGIWIGLGWHICLPSVWLSFVCLSVSLTAGPPGWLHASLFCLPVSACLYVFLSTLSLNH